MKNKAFTLAETLITLVIVGVVAALTVPAMVTKYQEEQAVTRLKKAYSILSQATSQIIADEGPIQNWVTSQDNVYNLYKKKLLNAKDCANSTGCFEQGAHKTLNGGVGVNFNTQSSDKRLILTDGIQINLEMVHPTCNYRGNGSRNACTIFDVDINGVKKPNTIGKDFFSFALKQNGLFPAGCDYDECARSNSGRGCACKVLRENAINY